MKKLKILIYGEGPDDYGWKDSNGKWCPGSIIYLLQKCANERQVKLEIEYVEKHFIDGKNKIKLAARHLREVDGKGIPALRFSIYALENGYTIGIFYCDTDKTLTGSQKDEANCRKHFEKVYSDVAQGLRLAGEGHWKGVPMISLKMIECWLLSDKYAYKKCFGAEPKRVKLPSKPELIWGEKNNPSSDYPKNYIKRILEQYHKEPDREVYTNIAEETSLDTLKEKCPISFAKFYEDFTELIFMISAGSSL